MSVYTRICRQFYVFRRSSAPYISGDSVRSFIKCRIEGRRPDYTRALAASIVFCEGDHVEALLHQRKAEGGPPFVLVSGNSDINFREDVAAILPDNLLHWYGQNLLFDHPRVSPLPIGLENRYYGNSGSLERIAKVKRLAPPKKARIFYSFNVDTNRKERVPALAAAKAHPFCVGNENRIPVYDFQLLMASNKFALSPPGNGFDCHRTWEAMYLGSIPIVKKSLWSDYFVSLGMPLLAVESWEELSDFDEDYLEAYYEENKAKLGAKALNIDYWKQTILGMAREDR